MIAPFYPCSYRCERALAWARACLVEMAKVHPAFVDALRACLSRPVLYFDHDHQLVFDGAYAGGQIAYRAVDLAPCTSPRLAALAAAIGRGSRLSLDDREYGCRARRQDGAALGAHRSRARLHRAVRFVLMRR